MEILALVIGSIAGIFVIIFGGRGLIDLARGFSERRRARVALAADSIGTSERTAEATADTAAVVDTNEAAGPTAAVPLVEPDPVYRRTFVGRDAELKQLHDAFDEALAGHGSLAMVVGEPGIGKTSLCEQLAAYVQEKGGKTLVGHCYEEGSLSLPYLAFVEAVRSYVLVLEPADLKAQLGQGADELARIVPEIRERMQIELGTPGEAEEERYRLLQAASDFLRRAAQDQPLLVVLEDLHDADHGTLDMLTHLARNLSGARLIVIGTYRDVEVDRAHPLASALAELRRVTSFERIALRGLSQDEVHRMLQTLAGRSVPWRWAEAVHHQTEGNPLFIQEVMRYLVEEDLLDQSGAARDGADSDALASHIPEGLRDVIGKRLTRLSAECNQVLAVAAVIGRGFGLDILQVVADVPEKQLFAALEEARGTAVIEEHTAVGAGIAYRFTHAYFRQTLYEEIIAPVRVRTHQQVGQAMETVYARTLADHAAELAEHFSYAPDLSDLAKAVHYGEMAAQHSMDVFAYGESARLLDRAIKIQAVVDPEDTAKRCDLLLALGRALLPTPELSRVFESIAPEALALAGSIQDQPRASAACQIALDAVRRHEGGSGRTTPDLLKWAHLADEHAPDGTTDRVMADLYLARVAFFSDFRADVALTSWRRALAQARQIGDPTTLLDASTRGAQFLWSPRHLAERSELFREAIAWPRTGSTRALTRSFNQWVRSLLSDGDRSMAERTLGEMEELVDRTRDPQAELNVMEIRVMLDTVDGKLESAADATGHLLSRADELGLSTYEMNRAPQVTMKAKLYLGQAASIAGFTGLGEAGFENGDLGIPFLDEIKALMSAHLGRTNETLAVLRSVPGERLENDAEYLISSTSLALLLESAVLVGDGESAAKVMPLLEPVISHPLVEWGAGYFTGVARHMGGAAQLLGDVEGARAYYGQGLEACATIGFRPEIALIRWQLGELLLDHYPDERAEAIEHLDFAIAEFREMKMQPSLERAEARRSALP